MGLRKDFLVHRQKTVEAFSSVSSDMHNISHGMDNLSSMIAAVESRVSSIDANMLVLREAIDKCAQDISLQKSSELALASSIKNVNDAVREISNRLKASEGRASNKINSFEKTLNNLVSQNKKLSSAAASNGNSIKKLLPSSKTQSLKSRKLESSLKESQGEIRKIKNLLSIRLRTIKKADAELEKKLRSQRRRISQLNKKIDLSSGIKTRSRVSRKTTTRKITPKKKVTIIKTPKRKITKTVTKDKVVTKKETPGIKGIYEVIKEKNPMI